ncbi:MAG: glycerol-3-phosphate dehydrogenase/oxidase [Gemmatimonadota bacterium]
MERDLHRLAGEDFDLLVVGGGVLGAFAARDAALRGLRIVLIDRADFGGATSANSLKIIHGGLRYLRGFDLPRMRESIRERSNWLRLAPHLVESLPILVPTRGRGRQSRLLLRVALAVNDIVSADRNRGVTAERRLPAGRALTREECLRLVPELEAPELSGAVLFHDAQLYSPERIILSAARGAAAGGAALANYVELRGVEVQAGAGVVAGVIDRLSDSPFEIRAQTLLNAAGAAASRVAADLIGAPIPGVGWSLAMNLMTRTTGHQIAIALPGASGGRAPRANRGERFLFLVPWRGRTILGTAHYPYSGDPAEFDPRECEPGRFLADVNAAWPGPPFAPEDIVLVHAGLLPIAPERPGREVRLLRRPVLRDHAVDGAPAAVTAIPIKFTTAPRVATRAVDLVCRKLGRRASSRSAETPLPGAPAGSVSELIEEAQRRHGTLLEEPVLEHLVRSYGTEYVKLLRGAEDIPDGHVRVGPGAPVIRAQFMHGVREEMAQSAEDLLWRRTELGPRGLADDEALRCAAEILARERSRPRGATSSARRP